MFKLYNNGPDSEPWGTPQVIYNNSKWNALICFLFHMSQNWFNQFKLCEYLNNFHQILLLASSQRHGVVWHVEQGAFSLDFVPVPVWEASDQMISSLQLETHIISCQWSADKLWTYSFYLYSWSRAAGMWLCL